MSGAPLALLASLLWGTADFLAGRASRANPAVFVAFVGQAAGLVALAVIVTIAGADADAFLPGAISGVFGVVAIVAFYRALALGTMSVVAPIVATSAIVPVIAGVVTASARARCSGSAWSPRWPASRWPAASRAARPRTPGERCSSRCSPRSGSASRSCFLGAAADHDALTGVLAARVVGVPVLALMVIRARAKAPLRSLPGIAAIGLLDTGANTAFAIATTGGLLSLVAVLGGLFPVVTVALAYFLLHERLQRHQRVGVALALAGIPLISV